MTKNLKTQRTTRTWINLSVIAAALAVVALGVSPMAITQAQDEADAPPPPTDEQRPRYDDRPRLRDGRTGMRESRDGMRRPGGRFNAEDGERPQGGRGRAGGDEYMLSDEEIEKAMAVLREYDPKIAAHAESLRESNDERYRMLVRRYMPQIRRLMYLKESQPESYEMHLEDARLGAECERLARELRESENKSGDLRKQLLDAVTHHFDLRQKIKEQQLNNLEQAVIKLRQQLDKRHELRGDLINERMEELTGEKTDRMW